VDATANIHNPLLTVAYYSVVGHPQK